MPPLLKLILIRIGLGVLTLFLVSVVVFVATQALPGDTARAILGREAVNTARYDALREQLGLNKPIAQQYLGWLGGVVTGDLGNSLVQDQPVTQLLGRRVLNTFILVFVAALLSIPISLLLGSLTALRRDGRFDITVSIGSLSLAALPEFVIGIILILLFATQVFNWLPAVSRVDPDAAHLPAARVVHPAGGDADAGGGAVHDPHPARQHDRGAGERVRDDGATQGPA